MHRHRFVVAAAFLIAFALPVSESAAQKEATKVTRFARFQAGRTIAYGIVESEQVRELDGDIFGKWRPTERTYPLSEVKLLVPSARPTQVLALAGNYKSHLGGDNRVTTTTRITKETVNTKTGATAQETTVTTETEEPGQVPTKFQTPQLFFKSPSCLIATGEDIVIPPGTNEVHYEAELVIVIGRTAKNVGVEEAREFILGVTCGNDVSARDWQKNDVQWWRAKGSDTFGPTGPFIVTGLNYDDLRLQLRLNGKVLQDERTRQLIHSVPEIVSFTSRHITLYPGDLIFTGTSGRTAAIKPGDKVEVELEGVGTLINGVTAAKSRE
jgi:2-keto-4-pentenoate hydratase/2-oxohepta-3-ene-1,7-dioic acid hydratase in catechol pathway